MYKRILVPTDGSDLSALAADAAIAFAQGCGSEIVAFSVVQPEPIVPLVEGAGVAGSVDIDVLMEEAQACVARVAEAAAKAGVPCKSVTAYAISPADEIVAAIERERCDLVFMATHGRRGLSRLIAGSVTQRVLAYAPVPVLVYRPRTAGSAHFVG